MSDVPISVQFSPLANRRRRVLVTHRAYVVLKEGANATEEDIINHVAGLVAPYKQLRGGVVFTNEIPKSASGKILRRLVRAQDEELRAQQQQQQRK